MTTNYNVFIWVNDMSLKIALLIILVIMIMLIALGVVKQYRERHSIFLELSMLLNEYELNIGFRKEKLRNLISNFHATGELKHILKNYLDNFNNTNNLNFDELKLLQIEEKQFLVAMFQKLGTSDYDNEKLQLATFKSYIEDKLKDTKEKKNKLCPLILKLTFLFALGLAIIFI